MLPADASTIRRRAAIHRGLRAGLAVWALLLVVLVPIPFLADRLGLPAMQGELISGTVLLMIGLGGAAWGLTVLVVRLRTRTLSASRRRVLSGGRRRSPHAPAQRVLLVAILTIGTLTTLSPLLAWAGVPPLVLVATCACGLTSTMGALGLLRLLTLRLGRRIQAGHFERALQDLQAARWWADPLVAELLHAEIEAHLGDPVAAEQRLRTWLGTWSAGRYLPLALAGLVSVLELQQRHEEARAVVEELVRIAPERPMTHVLHADLELATDAVTLDTVQRLKLAAELATRSLQRRPQQPVAHATLAQVLVRLGAPDHAREVLSRLQPELAGIALIQAEVHDRAARAWESLGDRPRAVASCTRVAELLPQSFRAVEAIARRDDLRSATTA